MFLKRSKTIFDVDAEFGTSRKVESRIQIQKGILDKDKYHIQKNLVGRFETSLV